MADPISGIVTQLVRYTEKGKAGIPMESVLLVQNQGMKGDRHAGSGERQISLLCEDAKRWMAAQTQIGLCFARFKENICFSGIPVEQLHVGTRLRVGAAVLGISAQSKRCHPECILLTQGKPCPLCGQSLFGQVLQGGRVQIGDKIEQEAGDDRFLWQNY